MSTTNTEIPKEKVVELINQTPASEIGELEFVKNKFIDNYNATHKDKNGELQYSKQLVHFKQLVHDSNQLKNCNKFSLYACFLTAAVNGYSLDPNDNEVYIVPLAGNAKMWPQAGAHVKRLTRTEQIKYADAAVLVYDGDVFHVSMGKVTKHEEKFQSEVIKYAYIRFVKGHDQDGKEIEKFIIYRKTDWEVWRKKSPQKNGENWTGNDGQPIPAFLKTKVTKHACMDSSWSTGGSPANVETFDVIIDDPNEIEDIEAVDMTAMNEPLEAQDAANVEFSENDDVTDF